MDAFPQYRYSPSFEEAEVARYRTYLSPSLRPTNERECEIKDCMTWLHDHERSSLTPDEKVTWDATLARLRELADLPDLPFRSLLAYFPYGKYIDAVPMTPYIHFLFNGQSEEDALRLVFWREFILDLIEAIEQYGVSGKVVYCNKPAKGQQWLKTHTLEPASLPESLYKRVQYLGEHYKRFSLSYVDMKTCLPQAATLSAQFTSSFEIIQIHNFYLLFTYY